MALTGDRQACGRGTRLGVEVWFLCVISLIISVIKYITIGLFYLLNGMTTLLSNCSKKKGDYIGLFYIGKWRYHYTGQFHLL